MSEPNYNARNIGAENTPVVSILVPEQADKLPTKVIVTRKIGGGIVGSNDTTDQPLTLVVEAEVAVWGYVPDPDDAEKTIAQEKVMESRTITTDIPPGQMTTEVVLEPGERVGAAYLRGTVVIYKL